MKIILLGPPGSGKGTIGDSSNELYGYTHISTGDILRENIKNQTEIGKLAKPLIDNGKFVPDEMIIQIVENKLEELKDNYILDGFPRTLNQAIALEKHMQADKIVYLKVSFEETLDRVVKRRTCSNQSCKKIFNTDHYDKTVCDRCGSALSQRDDDRVEVITHRFEVYKKQTYPVVEYYRNKNMLTEVDASGLPAQTFKNFQKEVMGE